MSLSTELDLMFERLNNSIEKKIEQICFTHYSNILSINNIYNDQKCLEHDSDASYHKTLTEARLPMITKLAASLKQHMNILDHIKEVELKLIPTNQTKNEIFVRNRDMLAEESRLTLILNPNYRHTPFNMIDILFPFRFEKKKFSNSQIASNHLDIIAKNLSYYHSEFQVIHADEYNYVRNVISLNNKNNFLIVLSTITNDLSVKAQIKLLTIRGNHFVKLNIAIDPTNEHDGYNYKVLAPKNKDRIIIKFRRGNRDYGFETILHVYDYKLNLMFSREFKECFKDMLEYKRLILCRTPFKTKLYFMNFLLQTLYVCELGSVYDTFTLCHFNCSLVYFYSDKVYPPGRLIWHNDYEDELCIVDFINKNVINRITDMHLPSKTKPAHNSLDCHCGNEQLSHLCTFDNDSNIYALKNKNDQLNIYNKYGELLISCQCKSVSKTFHRLGLMMKNKIFTNDQREYSLISTYKSIMN